MLREFKSLTRNFITNNREEIKMAFYEFDQNNSGGGFIEDPQKGISIKVWFEADTVEQAADKAQDIGIYFDGVQDGYDCACCGDRWYYMSNDAGEDEPNYYGSPLTELMVDSRSSSHFKWAEGYEVYVHYADGTIKGFMK